MFKKILLIILFLTLNLTFSLKSSDFCILKQQECKGFYDEKKSYQIKCDLIKCHGHLAYDCETSESKICSKNKFECHEYNNVDSYMKIMNIIKMNDYKYSSKNSIAIVKVKAFINGVKECEKKIYEFKSNDFCLNGKNCYEFRRDMKGFGFNYRSLITVKKIDCKCPIIQQSFRCGQYCATDSNACDQYNKTIHKNQFYNIKECINHNVTSFRYMN